MDDDTTAGPGGGTTFGTELRRLRLAAGWSLRDLAERLHYSKGYLSNLETGAKPPGAELARRCDVVLRAGGSLRALGPGERGKPAPAAPATADRSADWMLSVSHTGGEVALVGRREVLAGGAAGIFGWSAAAPSVGAVADDDATPEAYTAMLRSLRELAQAQPPALVLPTLVVQVQLLGALAAAAHSSRRPPLLSLAARFAEYAGWMFQECGDDRAMAWWTARAVQHAEAAGDRSYAAYADVRHANVAMYAEDGATTVELAARAVRRAPRGPRVARVHQLAHLRRAQGLAQLGEPAAAERALRDAAEAAGRGDAELGTWTVPDPEALIRGWCLHDLGRHDEAADLLRRHLRRVPATARRARARTGTRLALALAADGRVDEACDAAGRAVDDALAVDSATVRHDLRRLRRSLQRRSGRPGGERVAELLPRLTEALRGPATAAG